MKLNKIKHTKTSKAEKGFTFKEAKAFSKILINKLAKEKIIKLNNA